MGAALQIGASVPLVLADARLKVALLPTAQLGEPPLCPHLGIAIGIDPVEIAIAELGDKHDAVVAAIIGLVDDCRLSVTIIQHDGSEHRLTCEHLPALQAALYAIRNRPSASSKVASQSIH